MDTVEDSMSVEELEAMPLQNLALRALILGLMCADKANKGRDWADRELRKAAPIINKRFEDEIQ